MRFVLLATRNKGKTREFAATLGEEFEVRDLSELPIPPIEETGTTFEENAALKALAVSKWSAARSRCDGFALPAGKAPDTLVVVADDSGLAVDSLGDAPGVYSARYAGANASDEQNVEKLLLELDYGRNRAARFICVLAVASGGELRQTFRGEVEGTIVDRPRGTNGFGYDPVFQPTGYNATFAELSAEVKNRISHRARAITQLREYLLANA